MEKIVAVVEDASHGPPSVQHVGVSAPGLRGPRLGPGTLVFRPKAVARVGPDKARYDVYLTDRRIIAAVVFSLSDISKAGEVLTPDKQFAAAKATFGFKKIRDRRRQELQGKTPEEVLHAHPESFEVPYDAVQSVRVRKSLLGAKLEMDVLWEGNVETVDVPLPKDRVDAVRNFLNAYLPGRVTE